MAASLQPSASHAGRVGYADRTGHRRLAHFAQRGGGQIELEPVASLRDGQNPRLARGEAERLGVDQDVAGGERRVAAQLDFGRWA